jgi:hypothetical protein
MCPMMSPMMWPMMWPMMSPMMCAMMCAARRRYALADDCIKVVLAWAWVHQLEGGGDASN